MILPEQKDRGLKTARLLAMGFLAGAAFVWLAERLPQAVGYWQAQAPIRAMAREAARQHLSCADVLKNPAAAAGKPIAWFLTHPAEGVYYCEGNASWPIDWEGTPPGMAETGQSGSSHGRTVVAAVVKAAKGRITLRAYSAGVQAR